MNNLAISIIIPTMNRGKIFTNTLLAACEATKNINSEIIVINDSKTEKLNLDTFPSEVILLNNIKQGVASARNLGASIAKSDNILFLDDDIIINEENILTSLSVLNEHPSAAIILNWIYPPELTSIISKKQFGRFLIYFGFSSLKGWRRNLHFDDEELFEVEHIASFFLLMKKETFNKTNGYDENFPFAGAEDHDFAKRLKSLKINGYCYPKSFVLHNESDRVDLKPWLERKKRAGVTRRYGYEIGLKELGLNGNITKQKFIFNLYPLRNIFYITLRLIPNIKSFDAFYFKIVNSLCSIYIHRGFFEKKN
jgi:GT2 family glycosyltransferase